MLTTFIFREALRAVRRNKMRSSLTVLGVMIGIGAVICVVALGTAGSDRIQEQLGLRLESTKGPVPVIVIDHVERPSEN